MKVLLPCAAMMWTAAELMGGIAQAAPPQPVIQMPHHAPAPAAEEEPSPDTKASRRLGCLSDNTGYLRARIRGAVTADLAWKDAQIECGGEARPDGSGLRVTFRGPGPGGRPLRMVFGISAAREGAPGRELPTNLTVLMDGGRIFATRGDDKCTLDRLSQQPLPGSPTLRAWRIEAHGFCVTPANALAGPGRILVSRFDFAGRIEFAGRG